MFLISLLMTAVVCYMPTCAEGASNGSFLGKRPRGDSRGKIVPSSSPSATRRKIEQGVAEEELSPQASQANFLSNPILPLMAPDQVRTRFGSNVGIGNAFNDDGEDKNKRFPGRNFVKIVRNTQKASLPSAAAASPLSPDVDECAAAVASSSSFAVGSFFQKPGMDDDDDGDPYPLSFGGQSDGDSWSPDENHSLTEDSRFSAEGMFFCSQCMNKDTECASCRAKRKEFEKLSQQAFAQFLQLSLTVPDDEN